MSVPAVVIPSVRASMPKRPIREIRAREQGAIIKDWGGRYPVALVYPNTYHLGMSNLGLQVLYGLLNHYGDIVAERVFLDLPESVESEKPLFYFSLIAFTLSYELDYLNIPAILKNGGVTLFAAERGDDEPIVIAGGASVMANPAPVAPFFDVLCIGEAEVILPEALPILVSSLNREQKLKALANLPGIYVPLYWSGEPIKRQYARDLEMFPAHSAVLTPDTEFGHLYLIEVERGCCFGCRFCLVRQAFSPMRFHSMESLLAQAKDGLGYRRRLGLIGPVVSNHPHIEDLLTCLLEMGADFSLSSLRANSLTENLIKLIARGGARSLAIAPEAGSERLRQIINKGITEDDVLRSIDLAIRGDMRQIKLYFMIGLPTENDEDITSLINLSLKGLSLIGKQGSPCRLTLNIAPFIPKAGTPFQWLGMASPETLERRLQMIKKALSGRGIQVRSDSIPWSCVQGLLSKGDSKLAYAIAEMNNVSLSSWQEAINKVGIEEQEVLERWTTERRLPWRMITQDNSFLVSELKCALGE